MHRLGAHTHAGYQRQVIYQRMVTASAPKWHARRTRADVMWPRKGGAIG